MKLWCASDYDKQNMKKDAVSGTVKWLHIKHCIQNIQCHELTNNCQENIPAFGRVYCHLWLWCITCILYGCYASNELKALFRIKKKHIICRIISTFFLCFFRWSVTSYFTLWNATLKIENVLFVGVIFFHGKFRDLYRHADPKDITKWMEKRMDLSVETTVTNKTA